jgi:hypothetical protein
MSPHIIGTLDYWSEIPWQKCGEQEWAKALPDADKSKKLLLEYGICLNPLKMVRSKLAQFKETLSIHGMANQGSKRVMIDIYQCLTGRALLTPGIPMTCDVKWYGSAISIFTYEKTVNVKYYEQPIGPAHAKIDLFVPSKTLRFEAVVQIK